MTHPYFAAMRFTILAATALIALVALSGATRRLDVPITIEGDTKLDACAGEGQIVGLDPHGDGFLSVRSGPGGRPHREIDRLYNGNLVAICAKRGPWLGVIYGPKPIDCNVTTPWAIGQPYTGPCRSGWIHGRYVSILAG